MNPAERFLDAVKDKYSRSSWLDSKTKKKGKITHRKKKKKKRVLK